MKDEIVSLAVLLGLVAGFLTGYAMPHPAGEVEPPVTEVVTLPTEITEPSTETAIMTTETTDPVTEPVESEAESTEPATEPERVSLGKFRLTAYCPCTVCCGDYGANRPVDQSGNVIVYTASGAVAQEGVTVAVDPKVIPYGTRLEINGHTYIAQDCGGAVDGNHIDIYFANHADAWNFGSQYAEVFRLEG